MLALEERKEGENAIFAPPSPAITFVNESLYRPYGCNITRWLRLEDLKVYRFCVIDIFV